MTHETITEEVRQKAIKDAIVAREQECFGYEFNITNYRMLLDDLPAGEMPEHLKSPQSAEDAKEAALYHFRQDVTNRLLAEEIEMDKSRRVLAVLKKRLK